MVLYYTQGWAPALQRTCLGSSAHRRKLLRVFGTAAELKRQAILGQVWARNGGEEARAFQTRERL